MYRRHRFPQRYTRTGIELLACVDEAHETLSGPATRRILEREYRVYGNPEYARLAAISVSTSTTCATAAAIASGFSPTPKPRPHLCRSASAVIRKHLGYGYIDPSHAQPLNDFFRNHLNPYPNYHRPYAQAEDDVDAKGRKRIRYLRYRTPLETLLALPNPAQDLRSRLSLNALKRIATVISN